MVTEVKQYYTPKQLAGMLSVAPMTISHWTKDNKIKSKKVGGKVCIPIDEVKRLIAETGKPDTFYDIVYDAIEDRLDIPGVVDAKSIQHLVKDVPFQTVRDIFRDIMNVMVVQKKATKVKAGQWEIIRPNRRLKQPARALKAA
jgi:excisionase family DNA binding protein